MNVPRAPQEMILVACDVATVAQALPLVESVADEVGGIKLGLEFLSGVVAELATSDEREATQKLWKMRDLFRRLNGRYFHDTKLHDIPETMLKATRALLPLNPMFFNVHASAGPEALVKVVAERGSSKVLGVTILTSLDDPLCKSIYGDDTGAKVTQFAEMVLKVGADGIVCSPKELLVLGRDRRFDRLIKVTPGIRPYGSQINDQKRVMTPWEAIRAGADYIVIGRPITNPGDGRTPLEAVRWIVSDINLEVLRATGALISDTHVVLTSWNHSNAYVNKDALYAHTWETSFLCRQFARELTRFNVDVVVAPAIGGVALTQWTAAHLSNMLGREVLAVYAEKDGDGFAFKRGYDKLFSGRKVGVLEDVVTTGGSVKKVVELVRANGGDVQCVGVLCNRGGMTAADVGDVPNFLALTTLPMEAWEPDVCPLCVQGVQVNTDVGKGKDFLTQNQSVA